MRLLVLTRAFPYPPGEQFVAPEAAHWAGPGRRVTVMPWAAAGEPVGVDERITVDLTLARATSRQRTLATAKALVSPWLFRDLRWLRSQRRLNRATATEALQATRNALLVRDLLLDDARRHGRIDVVYSYWFDVWTLGALLATRADPAAVGHVATRVHGYDLHESRHAAGFHGLKRQLAGDLDLLLPVSVSGGQVAVKTFGVPAGVVHHAPLGTPIPAQRAATSAPGHVAILSVASALPVKRIDRLVDAARLLAESRPDLQVSWTHLGGGTLLPELRARAAQGTPPANLTVTWAGQVSPDEVTAHLAGQPVDVFVNTSESEGVPVSIMEAMAHGVPALAPRVGAIDELVPAQGPGGALLGSSPTPHEIAETLADWAERAKLRAEREAAHMIVADRYDADANAVQVVDLLAALAEPRSHA
ncbi:glycosyltransferase [Propionibacteriaceae bacterium G1746]|uniref:glycosyltransferase n=1 Tax=Aestuariimicrobium sp. G57 TaxID=3418485 RepID=UPI003C1BBAC0